MKDGQREPLPPKLYFFSLMPYVKRGRWDIVRMSLEKRKAEKNKMHLYDK